MQRRNSVALRKKTAEFIKNLDQQLNTELLKTIVNFFLVLGVAAFLSICCVLIGMVYMTSSTRILRATPPPNSPISLQAYEFAGFNDWNEFTSKCCCENHDPTPDANGQVVELWKCLLERTERTEFIYKRRLRADQEVSGLSLRPYCGVRFNPAAVCGLPALNPDTGLYQVFSLCLMLMSGCAVS